MNGLAIIAVVAAIIGLVVAVGLASWISKADEGNDRMKEIAGFIREGAMAFLAREYKVMVIVIAVLFLLIGFFISWITGILYVCGALLSVLAGFFGMKVATLGNVRTAYAAEESGMNKALKIAFRSGAVMGLAVTGLGLFGLPGFRLLLYLPGQHLRQQPSCRYRRQLFRTEPWRMHPDQSR